MKHWKKGAAVLAAAAICIAAAGCSSDVKSDEIVMHVGDYDVTSEFYNYYFLNEKYSNDGGDNSYWTDTAASNAQLKETTDSAIKEFYALYKMCDDAGITLTQEMNDQVEEEIAQMVEAFGGEEAFNEILSYNYMSQDLYRMLSQESLRNIKLFETMMGDEIRSRIDSDYIRAAHILIQFDDSGSDASKAAAKAKAEEVLKKVNSGEDFFALVDEYNEDPGMVDNRDGYYFTEGEMVTPFYEGALALKENETSGLVETEYGYHIIKRLPLEEAYIEANLSDFASNEHYEAFFEKVAEAEDSLEIKTEKAYDQITLEKAIKNEQ